MPLLDHEELIDLLAALADQDEDGADRLMVGLARHCWPAGSLRN